MDRDDIKTEMRIIWNGHPGKVLRVGWLQIRIELDDGRRLWVVAGELSPE